MKYKKMDINEKIIGKGFFIFDWKESDADLVISVKSERRKIKCPCCGSYTESIHSNYHRKIQTVPMKGKNTILDVVANKYDCLNEKCPNKVIVEPLPFAVWKQRRTIELDCLILSISCFLSDEGTSTVLKSLGINISNDSIRRLRNKLIIEDNPSVEKVGVDDVAIRKGCTYATAIYDMDDHHLIALLDGRDKATLKDWLMDHRKIKLVSRDRANAYAAAINEVLPDCVQVADRFHLLQNLISHMKDIFKDEIPKNIFIEDGIILDKKPKKICKIRTDSVPTDLVYDGSAPVDENGNLIIFNSSNSDYRNNDNTKKKESRKKNK